jgi:membrane-associated protease RseP (regulator of RpoE activity)
MKLTKLRYPLAIFALGVVLAVSALYVSADAGRKYKSSGDKSAWLGVYMKDIDEDMMEAFDLQSKDGAFVNDVIDDSPADDAGLRSGDVIYELDGNKIQNSDELTSTLRKYEPGDEVELKALRNGKEKTFAVELGKQSKDRDAFSHYEDAKNLYGLPGLGSKSIWISDDGGGYLGVSTIELSEQLAEYFGVRHGVLVTEVEEDSPAEESGIKAGDVIVSVDSESVDSPSELREIVRDYEKGDEVKLTVIRKEQEQTFTATLDEAPEGQSFGNLSNYFLGMPGISSLPSIPSIDKRDLQYLDSDEFKKEMDDLRDELKDLQEELSVIKKKLD